MALLESAEFIGTYHIGECHRGFNSHSHCERRIGGSGVEVPVPIVVPHELWQGIASAK